MADESVQQVIDVARHGGTEIPSEPISQPTIRGEFLLDENVLNALPIPGTTVVAAREYGRSLWGRAAKITTHLSKGESRDYFLKVASLGETGRLMIKGDFESLRAIYAVAPTFVPKPFAWGRYRKEEPETYFLLAEFRGVGEQPPDPARFTARLADLHKKSTSPTGKFGFHVTTCQGTITHSTACWEDSWEVLYRKQLAHQIKLDEEKHGVWPEFQHVCRLILEKVIPRLLRPLQTEGRHIKPCLIHGDLWDENTSTDLVTGEPFVFDPASMYAHNEYEIGNWRAARHRLSDRSYVESYKHNFPASAPEDDWDARNLLYSLRFNIGTALQIPGCPQRQVVYEDMTRLCKMFCPEDLRSSGGSGKMTGKEEELEKLTDIEEG